VWGYTGVSSTASSLRVFGYAPSRVLCDISLAKDRSDKNIENLGLTFSECRQVVVGVKGTPGDPTGGDEYWIYSFAHGDAMVGGGLNDQALCDTGRRNMAKTLTVSRECVPVGVRFLDQR
jgi:hypothetical protein